MVRSAQEQKKIIWIGKKKLADNWKMNVGTPSQKNWINSKKNSKDVAFI